MSADRDQPAQEAHDAPIAPFAYSPPDPAVVEATPRRLGARQLAVGFTLLAFVLFAWFLLSAEALRVQAHPPEAEVDIDGGPHLVLGESVLLRSGDYRVRATAPGYRVLEQAVSVKEGGGELELHLEKLPGLLTLRTEPVAARVRVDGKEIGDSNGKELEIAAGTHRLRLEAERFLPLEQEVQVEGLGKQQSLSLSLAPGWGSYQLDTEPAGATITLDGAAIGTTPATLELMQGPRQLQVALPGYRDESLFVEAKAGETRALDRMMLVRADARLRILSSPVGASITLDGAFRGVTPLELALESGKPHELIAFKAGHERSLRRFTASSGAQEMNIALRALSGDIRISVSPADAAIFSGARLLATGTSSLSLPAAPQALTVRRKGYADEILRVTPRPGFPQAFSVKLRTLAQKEEAATRTQLKSAGGQELALIRPGSFRMGSSRRESGRRANEAMREVRLTRPYYLSITEVSNAEFRQFRPAHSSGNFKGKSLNGDTQPASNLSWTDAALYCNWLSERENLKPFYRVAGKTIAGIEPGANGYRLPTEAEWAWAATLTADANLLRFPWGTALPPGPKSGNYADTSGESILGEIIVGYTDGFPVSSPVRSFAANRLGLFDIGGNAAEWVHDIYDAAPPGSGVETDPLGADIGEYHVIRGASWRHGGLTELRLAFRDYGSEARADVGFRIARYLK